FEHPVDLSIVRKRLQPEANRYVLLESRQCSECRQELGCCPWSPRGCKSSCSRMRISFSSAGLLWSHCYMRCCAGEAGKVSFWIPKAVLCGLLLSGRDSSLPGCVALSGTSAPVIGFTR